ncbi:MAG: hypothetical protein H6549_00835 [Chitinophagales bacterium]|nr:hypothetical protein [Chitinophagales bacterium]
MANYVPWQTKRTGGADRYLQGLVGNFPTNVFCDSSVFRGGTIAQIVFATAATLTQRILTVQIRPETPSKENDSAFTGAAFFLGTGSVD